MVKLATCTKYVSVILYHEAVFLHLCRMTLKLGHGLTMQNTLIIFPLCRCCKICEKYSCPPCLPGLPQREMRAVFSHQPWGTLWSPKPPGVLPHFARKEMNMLIQRVASQARRQKQNGHRVWNESLAKALHSGDTQSRKLHQCYGQNLLWLASVWDTLIFKQSLNILNIPLY